jgi:hypothetical protein
MTTPRMTAVRSPVKAASPPAAPTTYSNADKARADEQTNKASAYASKTPADNQERVALAGIVAQINDDIRAISGAGGGLQQPRIVK